MYESPPAKFCEVILTVTVRTLMKKNFSDNAGSGRNSEAKDIKIKFCIYIDSIKDCYLWYQTQIPSLIFKTKKNMYMHIVSLNFSHGIVYIIEEAILFYTYNNGL